VVVAVSAQYGAASRGGRPPIPIDAPLRRRPGAPPPSARPYPYAGRELDRPAARQLPRREPIQLPALKSPGLALLLSAIIPGVGQMYLGRVGKGFVILLTIYGSLLLYIPLLLVMGLSPLALLLGDSGTAAATVGVAGSLMLLVFLSLAQMGLYFYALIDAYRGAQRVNLRTWRMVKALRQGPLAPTR
jgi:TM2 domain-containing membrane protein YozV